MFLGSYQFIPLTFAEEKLNVKLW